MKLEIGNVIVYIDDESEEAIAIKTGKDYDFKDNKIIIKK
jgi:hypothetical protein